MILENIIYDVREALKQYTDDSELSDEYITYLYGIKRAKYLRQDLNNYQRTTDISVTQTLCLGLERVSVNECDLDFECETILRTTRPIPQPLELHIKSAITSVKPTNRISIPFNFTTKQKAIYSEHSPFNKAIFSFLDNDNYIYLLSTDETMNLLECITVTGVFQDPLELLNYTNCCDCEDSIPCYNLMTSNYPLPPHYIDLIKNEIVNEQLQKLKIEEDTKNNSVDDKE
jgi:hypothetical protein